jgi:hypothetical protein
MIRLDLEAVTLAAQQGIYHLYRRDDAAHQLDVELTLAKCNIANRDDSAWFEFDGGPEADDLKLRLQGSDNRYLRPNLLFARVRPRGEATTDLTLDDAIRHNYIQNFGQSTATLRGWEHPADPSLPIHEHRKENYVPSGTFATDTGFTLEKLPADAPETAPAEPESTASESTPE